MHYREALPADASAIIEFQLAMARETEELELDREILTRGVEAVFTDPALGRYYVAEEDGRVVGSLMITYEWSDWRNGMVWWIQSVYVIPEFRRRGVYAGLYAQIKGIVEQSAVRGIRLYVDKRNKPAQDVYTRLGMNGEHYQLFEWMK
ncbi:MAG TPA: GNAT family N-acetyltransferase [Thermoanaerobaculia bacterium]|nr:GNAT family N-acetyltransferase [Thermoanaerobaculia bacterium]